MGIDSQNENLNHLNESFERNSDNKDLFRQFNPIRSSSESEASSVHNQSIDSRFKGDEQLFISGSLNSTGISEDDEKLCDRLKRNAKGDVISDKGENVESSLENIGHTDPTEDVESHPRDGDYSGQDDNSDKDRRFNVPRKVTFTLSKKQWDETKPKWKIEIWIEGHICRQIETIKPILRPNFQVQPCQICHSRKKNYPFLVSKAKCKFENCAEYIFTIKTSPTNSSTTNPVTVYRKGDVRHSLGAIKKKDTLEEDQGS